MFSTRNSSGTTNGVDRRGRLLVISAALLLCGVEGCAIPQRAPDPPSPPLIIDEPTQRRDFPQSVAYYPSGETVAGARRFNLQIPESTPRPAAALLDPMLFVGQVLYLPFTYITEPPMVKKIWPGVLIDPTYTGVPPLPPEPGGGSNGREATQAGTAGRDGSGATPGGAGTLNERRTAEQTGAPRDTGTPSDTGTPGNNGTPPADRTPGEQAPDQARPGEVRPAPGEQAPDIQTPADRMVPGADDSRLTPDSERDRGGSRGGTVEPHNPNAQPAPGAGRSAPGAPSDGGTGGSGTGGTGGSGTGGTGGSGGTGGGAGGSK